MFSYIHIPFCESKCKYCKFASVGNLQKFKIEKYLGFLLNEIDAFDLKNDKLESIYFGGGTPTTLNDIQLDKIITKLNNKFGFNSNIEISLESTPNKITLDNLVAWKNIGINRLSIGVQSLSNITLKEIGRGDKGDILESLNNIKKIGFNNVSIDFIIGLPHVKVGGIKKDIEYILDNYDFIKHISVYMLEDQYYPGNWKDISLNENLYLEEYIDVVNFLDLKGFKKYEVSNFALKGYECKHNKSYWNHSNVVGFGLGAHSYVNNIRYANSDSFTDYYTNKLSYSDLNNKEDIFLEKLMFDLRTCGLKVSNYNKLNFNRIDEFIDNGYLFNNNGYIKTTNKGILILDYILSEIL